MAGGSTGKKKAAQTSSKDYFLAEGSLTWWAIGASLIASNISAETIHWDERGRIFFRDRGCGL
jgi:hypothetical protein